MTGNRRQGRPPRGDMQVGRNHIVEAAQLLLQANAGRAIGRNEIAEAASVTPALVNYYFRDQAALMEAVTAPTISRSIGELKQILRTPMDAPKQLEAIIRLFVTFNTDYAVYLDNFLEVCAEDSAKELHRAAIFEAYDELVAFFHSGMQQGVWRSTNPAFLVFALWGICKFVAQNPLLPVKMFEATTAPADMLSTKISLILDLVSRGLLETASCSAHDG